MRVYCDMIVRKLDDGNFVAGVELSTMERVEGRAVHTLFKVASMYIDEPSITSTLSCVKAVCNTVIDELPDETTTVIFRSPLPQFYQKDRMTRAVSIKAAERGVTVSANRRNVQDNVHLLALDAIERGSSVVAEI